MTHCHTTSRLDYQLTVIISTCCGKHGTFHHLVSSYSHICAEKWR